MGLVHLLPPLIPLHPLSTSSQPTPYPPDSNPPLTHLLPPHPLSTSSQPTPFQNTPPVVSFSSLQFPPPPPPPPPRHKTKIWIVVPSRSYRNCAPPLPVQAPPLPVQAPSKATEPDVATANPLKYSKSLIK